MSKYLVTSDRLIWPRGTIIDTADLEHSNIDALLLAVTYPHTSPRNLLKLLLNQRTKLWQLAFISRTL
jgi:hypothetical protein